MSETPAATTLLSAECQRVELLLQGVAALRQGQPVDELIARLRPLQDAVVAGRSGGDAWPGLPTRGLSQLEQDVLACVVAAELEPRVAWLVQQLQQPSQPYPCMSLIQECLAIGAGEAAPLWSALTEDAPLRTRGLVDCTESGPFAPLRPARGICGRLLGLAAPPPSPPGTMRVLQSARFADLVLPSKTVGVLREFLLWILQRDKVVGEWHGRWTGGPVALFHGPSGTGKSLAASVIASELGWPLYRVDLGSLVSKYVGETEKNLNRLFAATHGQQAVLLFDEADSLFGKRGEVKEARDRWANMEVSHLLSRIEQHDGPCILTTNLRSNLDSAFVRRFQAVVEFAPPDAAARAKLWAVHIPPAAPLSKDVDVGFLGSAVRLNGGGIRNASLHAAYLAAGRSGSIGLPELALAVWRELGKDGRALSPGELGGLSPFLTEPQPC